MMSIGQLHDIFENMLDRNTTQKYAKLSKDTIDTWLQAAQIEVINRYIGPVLPGSQARRARVRMQNDLRTLIVTNTKLDSFFPTGNYFDYMAAPGVYFSVLPHNYLFLLNARANTKGNIDGVAGCAAEDSTFTNTTKTEYIAVLPFNVTLADLCSSDTTDYRIETVDARKADGSYGTYDIFDYTKFAAISSYAPIPGVKEQGYKFHYINPTVDFLNSYTSTAELIRNDIGGTGLDALEPWNKNDTLEVYWESYRDQHYPDSFVFVSRNKIDVTIAAKAAVVENDNTYNDSNSGVQLRIYVNNVLINPLHTTRFRQMTYTKRTIDGGQSTHYAAPVTLTAIEKIHTKNALNFGRSKPEKPLGVIAGQHLLIPTSDRFSVDTIHIDYIKQPRVISHRFNVGSDLPEHMQHVVASTAVEKLLLTLGSQRAGAFASKNATQ